MDALARVIRQVGGEQLLDVLAQELPGTDLTTLLLEVYRRRAAGQGAAEVMRRYGADRFVAPGSVSAVSLRRAEEVMLGALPGGFDVVTLAPVVPLGTHYAMGGVDPRKVVATVRGSEVAADPTNGLALEAAARRRRLLAVSRRSAGVVKLAASQRATRAQLVSGPVSFAHFQLLGLVTAGRDTGSRAFEREHLAEHLRFAAAGLAALGLNRVRIALTCLDEPSAAVTAEVGELVGALPGVQVADAPEREAGRGYYRGVCFKVFAQADGEILEIGDGGFTDWTAKLLGNAKERLLISGYGLERAALLSAGS